MLLEEKIKNMKNSCTNQFVCVFYNLINTYFMLTFKFSILNIFINIYQYYTAYLIFVDFSKGAPIEAFRLSCINSSDNNLTINNMLFIFMTNFLVFKDQKMKHLKLD